MAITAKAASLEAAFRYLLRFAGCGKLFHFAAGFRVCMKAALYRGFA